MKIPSFFSSMRPRRFALALLLGMAAGANGRAADFTWTGPYGHATVFEAGPLQSSIAAGASGALDGSGDVFLPYLEADSLPATARADVTAGEDSFISVARLAVEEAQVGGLYISGGTSFTASGAGGSGDATIKLRLLIELPTAARIDLFNIRNEVPAGTGAEAFSLTLYRSDASGAVLGDELLAYSGFQFDAAGTWESDASAFYLLEVNSFVRGASAGSLDGSQFSFFVNLGEYTAVPEPGAGSYLVAALAVFGAFTAFRRQPQTGFGLLFRRSR